MAVTRETNQPVRTLAEPAALPCSDRPCDCLGRRRVGRSDFSNQSLFYLRVLCVALQRRFGASGRLRAACSRAERLGNLNEFAAEGMAGREMLALVSKRSTVSAGRLAERLSFDRGVMPSANRCHHCPADAEGFEPPVDFRPQRFSRPPPSTTRPRIRIVPSKRLRQKPCLREPRSFLSTFSRHGGDRSARVRNDRRRRTNLAQFAVPIRRWTPLYRQCLAQPAPAQRLYATRSISEAVDYRCGGHGAFASRDEAAPRARGEWNRSPEE